MRKIISIIVAAAGVLLTISGIIMKLKHQRAVAVIGGADGPTSVFIAGKVGNSSLTILLGILLVVLGIVIYSLLKKKK